MTAITATPVPTSRQPPAPTTAPASSSTVDNTEIASNFTTFLQLLTTQLQNQNPLIRPDTNQFTQQLVQFAQVEQQMKTNDSLSTLVSLQQTAQSTSALALVGATVVVNGATAQLANSQRHLDAQRHQAGDRDHHHRGFDRPDRLYRHLRASMPARRPSPGTATAMTADCGRPAATR